jgi:hypothetical protein
VLDHLLMHDGPAFWVDSQGYATTTTFARIAPSRRLLDRIYLARGFTAYQHFATVDDLPEAIERYSNPPGSDAESSDKPSLIVLPALDSHYRNADTVADTHAKTLLGRVLARLRQYAAADVPVLMTRRQADRFTAPLERVADHQLTCTQTSLGPRFEGDGFETLLYPSEGGSGYQTTFAYWRQLLEARATQIGIQPAGEPSSTDPRSGVGTAVTAGGESEPMTPDPLQDAWSGPQSPGGAW